MTLYVEGLPGPVKVELARRLGDDWTDLAIFLEIPFQRQTAFQEGKQAIEILRWMIEREYQILQLEEALVGISRKDLACLVKLGAINALSAGHRLAIQTFFGQPPALLDMIRALCREAVPENLVRAVPSAENGIDLLFWLLQHGRLVTGQVPLLTVLQRFHVNRMADFQGPALREIIESLRRHYGLADAPSVQPSGPAPASDRPVLLLEIMPQVATSSRCSIGGWLFDSLGKWTPVLPNVNIPEMVDLRNEDQIVDIVEYVRALAADHNIEPEHLILEFLLPIDRLDDPVEQWPDRIGRPLGTVFPVVVRPRERHRAQQSREWKSLQAGWLGICDRLMGCDDAVFPACLWWCEDEQMRALPSNVEAGACIGLSTVPDLRAPPSENPIFHVIYCGGPVVFWSRRAGDPKRFKADIETHLWGRSLRDLPTLIRNMRSKLWAAELDDSPCFHVTLLWDDARRRVTETSADEKSRPSGGANMIELTTTHE